MVRRGYRNISLPEDLYEELQEFVRRSHGKYVSVSELIRAAIRAFLDHHGRDEA